ncbi:adenylate kinase [Actinoplanes sp. L3-i22]|uniref:adenylate kinase n=1 Tax=Actinoplanes sp. L3-i22 TaxID=2836373 RepID=UPI002104F602|nr:adenylate kinase [Actinoplanes sp. L3-i22]
MTGSGKTTLARRIGQRTGLPWHAVDDLTWEPGWVEVPTAVQRQRIAAICAGDAWVLDSAYLSWIDVPTARADLIVCLDYPRLLCLFRLLRRSLTSAVRRTEICNGNTESLRALFTRDSIVVQQFRSFPRKRARMRAWRHDPAMPPVVLLRSPRATRAWLTSM